MQLAASAAVELLRARDSNETIGEVLADTGRTLDVDRIYIFEAEPQRAPGELVCGMHYEWVAEGITPEIDNPDMQAIAMHVHMPTHTRALLAYEDFAAHVRDCIPSERAVLEAQSIKSLLLAPVMLDDHLWGFIGVDAVRAERAWQPAEAQLLRLLGSMIAACIERRRVEARLRLNSRVFESTQDAVLITDLHANILAVNAAFTEITGYGEQEVLGRNPRLLHSGRHDAGYFAAMWNALVDRGIWQGEVWNRRKSGEVYPQRLTVSVVRDERGRPSHYVGVGTDIGALKQSQQKLEHLAHHDPLTDLPNRLLARSRLDHALQRARRSSWRTAVIFLDLDGFKHINDSLGHTAGDMVLMEVGQRLASMSRSCDTLARLGGDEFLVVVERLRDPQDAGMVADKLLRALEHPVALDGRSVFIGASAGISVFPEDGEDADTLVRNADSAMYQAKAAGRGQRCFYAPHMNADALANLELDTSLRAGLREQRFELHYQPKYSLADNRITGVEALLRLRDGQGGLIGPDQFIPLAERSGLIVPIGAWVLREACQQLRRWREAGFHRLSMAVNVSARQFRSDELSAQIQEALHLADLPGDALELELTESLLMDQPEVAGQRLHALKSLGLGLSLDDFGTGYSSLGYLIRFPIDTLKIDRSFIQGLGTSEQFADIVTSVIAMAQRMRLDVVAEGVETPEQMLMLREFGCSQAQGYLVSRPLSAERMGEWLAARGPEGGL